MTAIRKCCAQCFGDRGLQAIIPGKSNERGECWYCLSDNVDLVEPSQLTEFVAPLVNIYEIDPSGYSLYHWFSRDWGLFTHPRMSYHRAMRLLADALNNNKIVYKQFLPSAKFSSDRLNRWEELRRELIYQNRYFPKTKLDVLYLEGLLESYLRVKVVPPIWYRARLQTGEEPFPIEQMGAPPRRYATPGRANPAGIPYLYLGSTPETAVGEIRPHTGDTACVAEFTVPGDLKLVDLQDPRRSVSPLEIGDEDQLGKLRDEIAFLARLGEELMRPVVPQAAPFEYVPSQFLCELIKNCGYAGVLYRSSVSEGINLALFDTAQASAKAVMQYGVVSVTADIRHLAPT